MSENKKLIDTEPLNPERFHKSSLALEESHPMHVNYDENEEVTKI